MWNFQSIVSEYNLRIGGDFGELPEGPGVYLLFDDAGSFIYIGKASNLKSRITFHFSPSESNTRIKGLVAYAVWKTTTDVAAAEILEGQIFDQWVNSTQQYPFANLIAPPKSQFSTGVYDPRGGVLTALLKRLSETR